MKLRKYVVCSRRGKVISTHDSLNSADLKIRKLGGWDKYFIVTKSGKRFDHPYDILKYRNRIYGQKNRIRNKTSYHMNLNKLNRVLGG